ncbi:acetyltransferase [Vibrio cholerae]|nr:acetyltransferase [Vibrio cholerae]MCD1200613.1 acetyltransferase [Vibrio cholerae]
MVMVVVFEFSVMRCQPLRRALVSLRRKSQKRMNNVLKIQYLAFKLHNFVFGFS